MGGTRYGPGGASASLTRFNVDGSPDASFGTGGTVVVHFGEGDSVGGVVSLRGDERIIVAGTLRAIGGGTARFAVARFTPDGRPDPTFGTAGVSLAGPGGAAEVTRLVAVAPAPGGKVVAAGSTDGNSFSVVRYTASGAVDRTFGVDGVATADFGPDTDDVVTAVAVLPDGRVLAGGSGLTGEAGGYDADFVVARFTALGRLDPTFSADGKIRDERGAGWLSGMVLEPDGAVIVGGKTAVDFGVGR